jgi:hypothetical protein
MLDPAACKVQKKIAYNDIVMPATKVIEVLGFASAVSMLL